MQIDAHAGDVALQLKQCEKPFTPATPEVKGPPTIGWLESAQQLRNPGRAQGRRDRVVAVGDAADVGAFHSQIFVIR